MTQEPTDPAAGSDDLVPVFIPPLAILLAHAEKSNGRPLTEAEVTQIRDHAGCIMMAPEDAEKHAETRGYRDVEPENCWADWHRLRVQLTGNGYLPKLVLCVLGGADLDSRCGPILDAEGLEHEWQGRDDQMIPAFQASACRCDPSFTADDLASVAGHSRVLYLLSPNLTAQDAPRESLRFLHLANRLFEAGATAIKCESSGIAHGRDRWIELARDAEAEPWAALLRGYVQLPILNGDDFYTCGLHLLGQPDLIASRTLLRNASGSTDDPAWTAVQLFRVFAYYLLTECTPGQFASGHTFSLDAESPVFRLRWEECNGYEQDDLFSNPFGRWRFAELLKS